MQVRRQERTGSPGHRLVIVGRAQNQVVLILFSCPKQTRKPVEQLSSESGREDGWEMAYDWGRWNECVGSFPWGKAPDIVN